MTARLPFIDKFTWALCAIGIGVSVASISSQALAVSPVLRTTVSGNSDLVDAMAKANRLDAARRLCEDMIGQTSPLSDAHAWWTVKYSDILAQSARNGKGFSDQTIAEASLPVQRLLDSHPTHPRRLFLEAQLALVLFAAASDDVIRAAVTHQSDEDIDNVLRRMIRFDREVEQIATSLKEATADLFRAENAATSTSQSDSQRQRSKWLGEDYQRLSQQMTVAELQSAVLRSELFRNSGSADFVGAAAKAIRLASDAVGTLPVGSKARDEVEKLYIESLLRAGDSGEAAERLRAFVKSSPATVGIPSSQLPDLLSMAVRIDLARQRPAAAKSKLDSFYRDAPAAASSSLSMDLARLHWLISGAANGQSRSERPLAAAQAARWMELIGQKHGAYAGRRAEAIVLASLPKSDARLADDRQAPDGGALAGSSELVAIQGREQLRRGNALRAGQLLSRAALADQNPARSTKSAIEAAAAFDQVKAYQDAADVLASVAIKHPGSAQASLMHLQSAIFQSKTNPSASTLLKHLQTTASTWPRTEYAQSAKQWALTILQSTNRQLEAAQTIQWTEPSTWTAKETDGSLAIWKALLHAESDAQLDSTFRQFTTFINDALSDREVSQDVRDRLVTAAVLLLDGGDLRQVKQLIDGNDVRLDAFIFELNRFRSTTPPDNVFTVSPGQWLSDASWRLMRDGDRDPGRRNSIASVLDSWHQDSVPDASAAKRLVWLGQTTQAISAYRTVMSQSKSPGKTLRSAAVAVGEGSTRNHWLAAIDLWDEYAGGVQKGSRPWHEAKLAAAQLLIKSGEHEQASKRLQYVILTTPPEQQDLKQDYQMMNAKTRR